MTTLTTVGERLAKAQEGGDPEEIRAALLDAKAAGADPEQIDQALAEVDRSVAASASGDAAPSVGSGGYPGGDEAAELRSRAESFKKKGNDRLKDGTKSAAREALEFFTMGLEVRCSDTVLNSQLFGNRAHTRMMLRQFVEAVDDCRKALELDSKNIKNYFRAAKASMHLDLCRNGMDFCEEGLKHAPNDPELMKLRDGCAEKLNALQLRRAERASSSSGMPSEFNADEAMAVQERVTGLNEQIETLKHSIGNKQRMRVRLMLTQKSVEETPPETRLYKSVGRGFVVGERASMEENIKATIEALEQELPKLMKTHEELEKRKENAEKELREMVSSFKQQGDARGSS